MSNKELRPTISAPFVPSSEIDFWFARCGGATASTVAIQQQFLQGEFAQDGLRVASVQESDNREIRDSHFDHRIPSMFREGGNIPPIWAKASGKDTVVIGITWVDEYQAIVTRPDSGIRTIADLKGRRLGIPNHEGSLIDFPRGMAVHGFVTALGLVNLTPKDAEFVDIRAEAVDHRERRKDERRTSGAFPVQALLRGEVDAIYLKGSFGYAEVARYQLHQVVDLNSYSDPTVRINNGTPRPITVGREFLRQKPELVTRYLAVLLRTAKWAETHAGDVRRAIALENQTSEEEVVIGYGNDLHLRLTPKLSEEYIVALEIQKNFLRDYDFLPNDFDFRSWIAHEPLLEAQKLVASYPKLASEGVPVLV